MPLMHRAHGTTCTRNRIVAANENDIQKLSESLFCLFVVSVGLVNLFSIKAQTLISSLIIPFGSFSCIFQFSYFLPIFYHLRPLTYPCGNPWKSSFRKCIFYQSFYETQWGWLFASNVYERTQLFRVKVIKNIATFY